MARAYADAVHAREFETAAALLDPEVEVVPPSGRAYGLDGLKASWTGAGFDHLDVALEERELTAAGEGAVLRMLQVYRWREDGTVAYVRPLRTRFDVSGDRIVRIEIEVDEEGERDG